MRTSLVPATIVALLWAASSEAMPAQQDERPRINIRIEQADLSESEAGGEGVEAERSRSSSPFDEQFSGGLSPEGGG